MLNYEGTSSPSLASLGSSWVDSHLARTKISNAGANYRKGRGTATFPELRVQRHNLPPEFEELYARFVSMFLVLDPRKFLDILDDCFRDTVDHMNSPALKAALSTYLGQQYHTNEEEEEDVSSGSYFSPKAFSKESYSTAHNMSPGGIHAGHSVPGMAIASPPSGRRRRRPRSAGKMRRTNEDHAVRYNQPRQGYSTWMSDRTKLRKEKKELEAEVKRLESEAVQQISSQEHLFQSMQMKIRKLEKEMQAVMGQNYDGTPSYFRSNKVEKDLERASAVGRAARAAADKRLSDKTELAPVVRVRKRVPKGRGTPGEKGYIPPPPPPKPGMPTYLRAKQVEESLQKAAASYNASKNPGQDKGHHKKVHSYQQKAVAKSEIEIQRTHSTPSDLNHDHHPTVTTHTITGAITKEISESEVEYESEFDETDDEERAETPAAVWK